MPKAPPCSQYEPPVHSLVKPKGRAQYCRKAAAKAAPKRRVLANLPSPARVVRHPMNRPKKAKAAPKRRVVNALPSPARVVRHPMNRPKKAKAAPKRRVVRHPMNRPKKAKAAAKKTADPNKGKFLVALKFNFRNTRNSNTRFNNMNNNTRNTIESANAPTNNQLSNYMNQMNGNKKFYERYLENLYSYGNYSETPKVKNYKNATVRYIIDPKKKGFFNENKVVFPNTKSIKNNLNRTSLANGIWGAPPGSHGVYPVATMNGLNELGVIGFKNVKVSKI
jgi:hypothetical protein